MPIVEATVPGGCKRKRAADAEAAAPGDAKAEKTSVELTDLETAPTVWADKIAQLKKNTVEARVHRQKLAKELKAAQRKNKRLKERARFLSEEDMVQILVMKRAKTAATKEEAESSASSSSKGGKSDNLPKPGQADRKTSLDEEDEADILDSEEKEAESEM